MKNISKFLSKICLIFRTLNMTRYVRSQEKGTMFMKTVSEDIIDDRNEILYLYVQMPKM